MNREDHYIVPDIIKELHEYVIKTNCGYISSSVLCELLEKCKTQLVKEVKK